MSSQYQLTGASASEIVASVERGVADGALAPGARLPSVRALATRLDVSPTTVAAALAELRRRGVVVSRPRSGTRIGERPPLSAGRAAPLVPAGTRDLATGNPDPALLPDLAAALPALAPPRRRYGDPSVDPELAAIALRSFAAAPDRTAPLDDDDAATHDAAIPDRSAPSGSDDAAQETGAPVPCRVCVVNGALDGIERVLAAQLRPGDAVAVEEPGWPGVHDLVRALSLRPIGVALDARGMRPESLARALGDGARAVVLTPRAQNPLGAAHDGERAAALRAVLAGAPDALLVEDDHLGPVGGAPWHSATGASARWAIVRSLSKWLGPDLRCAVVVGDEQTLTRVEGRQSLGPGWVSGVLQRLAATLWADPETPRLIARASAAYAERRAALLDALAAHGIAATAPSGLNVWVPVPDEDAAVRALLASGAAVAAGARFRLAGAGPGALRVTTAALAPADAPALAATIAGASRPAPRTHAA